MQEIPQNHENQWFWWNFIDFHQKYLYFCELGHGNQRKSSISMIFDENQWKSMEIMVFHEMVIFVMELDSGIAVEQCKVPKIYFHEKICFSWQTKTRRASLLTSWRAWEHFGTTQNHQNPWFSKSSSGRAHLLLIYWQKHIDLYFFDEI